MLSIYSLLNIFGYWTLNKHFYYYYYTNVVLQILLLLTHHLPQIREVSQEFIGAVSMFFDLCDILHSVSNIRHTVNTTRCSQYCHC